MLGGAASGLIEKSISSLATAVAIFEQSVRRVQTGLTKRGEEGKVVEERWWSFVDLSLLTRGMEEVFLVKFF